ncbi:MAG: GTP 3',8-cyclase MoaA [Ignavibacteriaceae bacterium]
MIIHDKYGRSFKTLRVSLTNSCNFSCSYCVTGNAIQERNNIKVLDYTELAGLVLTLDNVLNFDSVRLTGGEPTLYNNLLPFIKLISSGGIKNITMTTNGFLLKQKAGELASLGIKEINVSLDAVDPDIFYLTTRRKCLDQVLEGIETALNAGISVKLNAVIMRSINEHQVLPLIEFALSKKIKLRYLELMRMGHLYSRNFMNYFFPMNEILEIIQSQYPVVTTYRDLSATAKYFVLEDGFEFGIIANETEPFCFDCDRLRLDSYGNIYGCISESMPEYIADISANKIALKMKLNNALAHKQPLKFTGSSVSMIEIGG